MQPVVLLHSPLVGPLTWAPVTRELRQRGIGTVLPVLTNQDSSNLPYWVQHAAAVARRLEPMPLDVVSSSSIIAARVHSCPPSVPSALTRWRVTSSSTPVSHTPVRAVSELIPNAGLRQSMPAELHPHGRPRRGRMSDTLQPMTNQPSMLGREAGHIGGSMPGAPTCSSRLQSSRRRYSNSHRQFCSRRAASPTGSSTTPPRPVSARSGERGAPTATDD